MPLSKTLRLAAAVLFAASLPSCATTARYPGDRQANAVTIVVNNKSSTLSSMTVHLLTPDGVRQRLGTVNLNESRSFTVQRAYISGTYRLMAEPLGQRDLYSHEFTLSEGDLVEWNLKQNYVQLRGTTRTYED